jgi:hypothetical protein
MADKVDELELMYKEKVRLNEVVDNYAASSFNDFKMLGALGSALVIWEPILNVVSGKSASIEGLFFSFLGINIAITLVGLANLSKHSVMNFYLDEVQVLEKEIRNKLNYTDYDVRKPFQGVGHWKSKGKQQQTRVAKPFFKLISAVAIFLPTIILIQNCISCQNCKTTYFFIYPLLYFIFAVLLAILYFNTYKIVNGKKSQQ